MRSKIVLILKVATSLHWVQERNMTSKTYTSRQGKILRQWFEEYVLSEYQGRVLAVDRQVARHCARLHVPDKRSLNDSLIAATAFINGMTVVTRNIADFTHMDIPLLNPWADV
ncbi:PilT protein-like [Erwinia tasmaniensis Et1/99]|uniref:PilT protein-like n=2 Tax=Erwinia tasmaniensis TaxID=338565 RepID=B2VHM2_ERWT9|nr:PilT protein-like [Erwinia tasmaniensis Et1/99]